MKTIEIKLYKFEELSSEAQDKVIEELYDINISHEWWEYSYEDAKNVGIKITGFDLDRANYCKIEPYYKYSTIANKIMAEHGENCETYILAETFLKERDEIIDSAELDENGDFEDQYLVDEKLDDLENEFEYDLENEYLSMLKSEFEYLTSNEAIIETIEANEYNFTEEGEQY